MKIEYIKIEELKEYKHNAKEHPQEQIDQIAASIKEFGNNDPIAIDENNTIIEGHGRLYALRQLEYEKIPVIRLNHMTEDQKRAYIIAHNKLTMNSGFHLETILSELEALDGGLKELTGFTDEEISDMFDEKEFNERERDMVSMDDMEEISISGDIWILDDTHRIICGDSTDEKVFDELFSDGTMIDMVLTDPPYNVGYVESSVGLYDKYQLGKKLVDHRKIENDKIEDYSDFMKKYYHNIDKYSKDGTPMYIFYGDNDITPILEFEKIFKKSQILIWNKESSAISRVDYHPINESIIYGWKEGAKHKWYGDFDLKSILNPLVPPSRELDKKSKKELLDILRTILDNDKIVNSIFFHHKQRSNSLHPTMKPVEMLQKLMRNSSLVGDVVFDGFIGSGSTLIASDNLRRKFYGIELDGRYVDTTIIRYINYKIENNEEYTVKLIRNGEVIELEDTGLLELIE